MDRPITRNEWVMAQLRRAILSGEFPPGTRIKAELLATEWGVSPTPIRESLQRLASSGLVDLAPGRGARVAELSTREMVEIYSIRLLLEPFALRVSVERRTPEWEEHVKSALAVLREELKAGVPDVFRFEELHRGFHEALIAGCDSTWLLRLYRSLNDQSVRYRLLSLGPRGGPAEVLLEHERLAEACLQDDVDSGVRYLFEHIRRTVDSVLPELSSTDEEDSGAKRFGDVVLNAGRLLFDPRAGDLAESVFRDESDDPRPRRTRPA